jgi:hypothetical protein
MTHVEVVVSVGNAVVMGAVGLALWWAFKGRFEAIEKRFDAIDARIGRMEAEILSLRSDLTMVALAVGAKPGAGNE